METLPLVGLGRCRVVAVSLSRSFVVPYTADSQPLGPDCKDTAAFVKAANMQGFQTLLRACKAQYADYESVDYGFEWKTSIPLKWAMWGIPKRIGFVLSTAASFGLAVPVWLYKGPDS